MTFIIGLAGPANVGKSTTAQVAIQSFKKKYPHINVGAYAFATPIYEMVSTITGWPISKLKDRQFKDVEWTKETAPLSCLVGFSPRSFLQKVGTECFRNNIHSDFWIDLAKDKVKQYDIAIMEDARFENEFKGCDLVIELERTGVTYECNHPSAMPPDPKYIKLKVKIDSAEFNIDNGIDWIVQMIIKKKV
jgi:hypothetical protein